MMPKKNCFTLLLVLSFYETGKSQELPTQKSFLSTLLETAEELLDEVIETFMFELTIPKENVKFILYSPDSNQTTPITSHESLNPNNPTKILIHGFNGNPQQSWIIETAFLYHQKGPYNVIAVDWSLDATNNYVYSSSAVQGVGIIVGEFILNITNHVPKFLQSLHLIGHSLGSHVAGFAGKRVANESQVLIDRITGLDPAGPLFEILVEKPAELRIDQSDADFVDLIHTDAGFFGVNGSYGTVDFFVNQGGPIQPDCVLLNIIEAISCSHAYALVVFRQTIEEPEIYKGVSYGFDKEVAFMGDEVSRNASGNFYVDTE